MAVGVLSPSSKTIEMPDGDANSGGGSEGNQKAARMRAWSNSDAAMMRQTPRRRRRLSGGRGSATNSGAG
jgi:hypothetical protein